MVCMVPLCLLFLMTGIVSAIGNTYFIEAASHMNGKIWGIKTTVLFFPFLFNLSRSNAKAIWHNCDPGVGVLVALVVAILCCITAAIVETFRLAVVKSHGLIDLPDATVPMSRFWLVPQYVFLGVADGLFELSIVRFYIAFVLQWPIDANLELVEQGQDDPRRQYVPLFAKAISGVGILFSVLSVHVVGEIKPAWFQHTLNTSRLQNYYWTLAALTSGNLVITGLVFLACVLASNSSEDYQRLR
ncbi:protein NRT1/ PTR FAMILY 5.5-like [Prunus avium]|uniref:Protein NRT1/ PTR FAMILY 5.5-like n=1 Tax=Prunus avium TaxID=42229 RepID=A0A6P5TPI9_PRUAV|nr:protein NRT1/ PTR FAMILY 5.5-like [Prunus avium]